MPKCCGVPPARTVMPMPLTPLPVVVSTSRSARSSRCVNAVIFSIYPPPLPSSIPMLNSASVTRGESTTISLERNTGAAL